MIGNIRIGYANEAEYQSTGVDLNIHYYTGDRFNTRLLSRVDSPTLSVYLLRKLVLQGISVRLS